MVEWRNFEIIYLFIYFYLFYFVGLEYLIKKPKCSPECSRGAMGLLVQMAVPGELFLTIFSVCLPLFENERANMELFMNQMLNLFSHPIITYVVFQLASRCRL